MVYAAGMVYWYFFGRREIIPPLLSGRLPYRYAVGRTIAAKFIVHSAVTKFGQLIIRKTIKIVASRCVFLGAKYAKNAFAACALPWAPLGELTVLPQTP